MAQELPVDKMPAALTRIATWRSAPAEPVSCPVCEAAGLVIIDRSARPYAEWYALSCAACGLDTDIHIPMAPPFPTSD
jgi:transcription elongation factor Elf1